MKKPYTCSYCEEGIWFIPPSENKVYCKKHLETEFMGNTPKHSMDEVKHD